MSILHGIVRLARLRSDGFSAFAASTQALLNSIAPLLAFPLVGGLIEIANGQLAMAMTDMLSTVIALLTPLVVSEFLATRWGRHDHWMRYAVASTWSQWTLPMLLMVMVLCLWTLASVGFPIGNGIVGICVLGLVIYGIALHWFLARAGLGLSRGKATLLVLTADLMTGVLVLAPRFLVAAHDGSALSLTQ